MAMRLRTLWMVAMLVPLAGCLGFGDDDEAPENEHDDCPEDGHDDSMDNGTGDAMDDNGTDGTGEGTGDGLLAPLSGLLMQANETGNGTDPAMLPNTGDAMDDCPTDEPLTPNLPPVAVLTATLDDGTPVGPSTYILKGETFTFSARNSTDDDGTVVLAGLTVQDTNSTRSVNMVQDGNLIDVVLKFDHDGPATVTLNVIDDGGDGNRTSMQVYIADQGSGAEDVPGTHPTATGCARPVPSDDVPPLVQEGVYAKKTFVVDANARWISVDAGNTRHVSICAPDGTSLGDGEDSASTADQALAQNPEYYLTMYRSAGADVEVTYTVTIHFEPKPAA